MSVSKASETVTRAAIGPLGPLLGSGGQGSVYAAPGISLPDIAGELVFKEYHRGQEPPHGLQTLVSRRLRMDEVTRARLDRSTAWPVRLVEEDGQVRGVLMRLIPDEYFQQRIAPSGRPIRSLREIQHLFVDPTRSARLGMPPPTMVHRLMLCRSFAAVLHFLHRNDLVVGDLNAKNAVFTLGDLPSVMLIDCDAVRIKGTMAVVQQLNAPDWDPPEDKLSQATDLYKFGLFVLRCLGPGSLASVSRDPARAEAMLDEEGRALLGGALHSSPAQRPTAQVWGRYLDSVLTGQRSQRIPTAHTQPLSSVPPAATTATSGWKRDPVTRKWVQVGH
jgi:hypothetical protein